MKTIVAIVLAGKTHGICWDPETEFRADDIGLPAKLSSGQFGFSVLCQMIWVMMDDAGRKLYPAPIKIANAIDKAKMEEYWALVIQAWESANGEEDKLKNASGGNAPSPESNSGSAKPPTSN